MARTRQPNAVGGPVHQPRADHAGRAAGARPNALHKRRAHRLILLSRPGGDSLAGAGQAITTDNLRHVYDSSFGRPWGAHTRQSHNLYAHRF